ncbi:caleosin domain containing protein [Pyrenophora tritici-repentis]|uniref:Caleosin domain containing protein n=2 Tax=Pyrenophora tritici-repentis TaxID=45151 RepID=A0A2W1FIW1_9PLEO|nr:caleosin domain containing protein [Pyrenophora tritici-repentis Pt-1C-BFP]KAA8611287.1 caleosin domain-containing protein [Pyrenophora tritici-repentis]EDU42298.1 caleosin domain containing protein [Pyrenophora tritici-repentis Pt-1C-BFP]KAF7442106.1 caleosin domain containing protein [Pyrenophora tritici-repentis]KAF7579531.1 caleosin domain containing protein [Pyrenophora tritici-repentis]KAG9378435.1 caleosin domain containing protein [Pyrenophora tritici-repentis]
MAVRVSLLSAEATFNFTGNGVAGRRVEAAEVAGGFDGGGDGMARELSTADTNNTLIEETNDHTSLRTINWIAGVGDICSGTSQGLGSHEVQKHALSHGISSKQPPPTHRTALHNHCTFWSRTHPSIIYPWDIYTGFHALGFHPLLCIWAAITMSLCSSYATQPTYMPHPFFAINLDNIAASRHGSTTGVYDLDAELDLRRLDKVFNKYAGGRPYLTGSELYAVWKGQCCANDWFGWFAGGLEWIALYILLWPEDGKMYKEEIRGVYDGSIFWKIAEARARAQGRKM